MNILLEARPLKILYFAGNPFRVPGKLRCKWSSEYLSLFSYIYRNRFTYSWPKSVPDHLISFKTKNTVYPEIDSNF